MTPSNLIRLPMLPPRALLSSVLSPVLVAVLAACGGGSGGAGSAGDAAATVAAPPGIAAPSTVQPLSPLLDDEGNLAPSDPAAVPSDPAARTRAGRYATAAQARALEVALDQRVLRTVVEPAANQADTVALAVHLTYALQAAHEGLADALQDDLSLSHGRLLGEVVGEEGGARLVGGERLVGLQERDGIVPVRRRADADRVGRVPGQRVGFGKDRNRIEMTK